MVLWELIDKYMDNPRLYDDQYNKLVDAFSTDDHLKDFYDWSKPEGLKNMSASQYWFARAIWQKNEYLQLKRFLDKFLQHK